MAEFPSAEEATGGPHIPSGKSDIRDYHQRIDQFADAIEQDVIGWRHDIHQNAELSNREFGTAKKVADHLTSLNFDEVRTGIAPTGVVGILRGGKPGGKVIALRADMDALPVQETADVPFRSTRVDQDYPGGEPFGGEAMLKAGAFDNPKPDFCFGMHISPLPVGHVAYVPGTLMAASEIIKIDIQGKQTHGSSPWTGLDPLPVLAAIDNGIAQIYRQIDANQAITISIGKIDTVGRTNIIGERITAWGTVRAIHDEVLDDINQRLERAVTHAAEMHGLTATFEYDQYVPSVVDAPEWVERFKPTLERVVGNERLHVISPTLGYDDVSQFINATGGIYVVLGGQNTRFENGKLVAANPGQPMGGLIPNHNPAFYALDEALKTGVRLHSYATLDLLSAG